MNERMIRLYCLPGEDKELRLQRAIKYKAAPDGAEAFAPASSPAGLRKIGEMYNHEGNIIAELFGPLPPILDIKRRLAAALQAIRLEEETRSRNTSSLRETGSGRLRLARLHLEAAVKAVDALSPEPYEDKAQAEPQP